MEQDWNTLHWWSYLLPTQGDSGTVRREGLGHRHTRLPSLSPAPRNDVLPPPGFPLPSPWLCQVPPLATGGTGSCWVNVVLIHLMAAWLICSSAAVHWARRSCLLQSSEGPSIESHAVSLLAPRRLGFGESERGSLLSLRPGGH